MQNKNKELRERDITQRYIVVRSEFYPLLSLVHWPEELLFYKSTNQLLVPIKLYNRNTNFPKDLAKPLEFFYQTLKTSHSTEPSTVWTHWELLLTLSTTIENNFVKWKCSQRVNITNFLSNSQSDNLKMKCQKYCSVVLFLWSFSSCYLLQKGLPFILAQMI